MTVEHIHQLVVRAEWFVALGTFQQQLSKLPIRHLSAWNERVFNPSIDAYHSDIASTMEWLPSSRDQTDPFYADQLILEFQQQGAELRSHVIQAYKAAMSGLRHVEHPLLHTTKHHFVETAKGAALYCVRMAAIEAACAGRGYGMNCCNCMLRGIGLVVCCQQVRLLCFKKSDGVGCGFSPANKYQTWFILVFVQ